MAELQTTLEGFRKTQDDRAKTQMDLQARPALDPKGSCQFLAKFRSFSAVSAPIFARKYAFFSIFQNLPDCPAENFEIWQNFVLIQPRTSPRKFTGPRG